MEILNAEAIKKHPRLFTRVSKLNEVILQRNANQKEVSSSIYSFSINTNLCKMITVDGFTTYTFEVIREQDNGFFENLVVKELANGTLETKLYKYDVTAQEKENILTGIDVDMTNKISTLLIDDPNFVSDIFSKVYYSSNGCYSVSSMIIPGNYCKDGIHMYGDNNCVYVINNILTSQATPSSNQLIYTSMPCDDNGGGGPSGPTDTGGFDGGGTSPTGGGPTEFEEIPTTTPCQELKKMTENDANKNSLEILKTKTQGAKEFGFAVKKTANGAYATPEVIPQNPKNNNALDISAFLTGEYIIIMHNHPNPSVGPPMFSGSDVIIGLLKNAEKVSTYNTNQSLTTNFQELAMTLAGYDSVLNTSITFVLKIKDWNIFNATFNSDKKKADFDKLIRKNYEDLTAEGVSNPLEFDSNRPATLHDFKDVFLKEILNKGIGLYQAVPGLNNTVNWSEVVYNTSQGKSTLIPCNN